MARQAECKSRIVAYVESNDPDFAVQVAVCPACTGTFVFPTFTDDMYFEGDPEEVFELVCDSCRARAESVCGAQELEGLAKEGEIELYDQTIKEVCQLLDGWKPRMNA